ncbi:MAG: biopolymer transporter Tol [bacterium]
MNFRFHLLSLALLISLSAPVSLQATDAPTITVRKSDALNVAFTGIGGSEGAAASSVVQNDLKLAGWFSLVQPGLASFKISGVAAGGTLQGKVEKGGEVILSKSYAGTPRSAAHQFVNDIVQTLTGHPGIASSMIAFVSNKTGRKEVCLADYDGANGRQITHDGGLSVSPSLSPNGHRLAYTGYQAGYADIYVIDLTTGARVRLVKFPGTNSGARFSPDGNSIACSISKDGNPELYVVGMGGGARRLTHTRGAESSPTWSPSGSEIIYACDDTGGPQLYRIASGGGSGRLVPTGYGYSTEPSWSPDGQRLAFNVRSGGGFSIAVMDLNGGGTRIVAQGENPVWGADSRHLAYSTGSTISLLDVPTGKSTPVISGLGKVTEPTWSR